MVNFTKQINFHSILIVYLIVKHKTKHDDVDEENQTKLYSLDYQVFK